MLRRHQQKRYQYIANYTLFNERTHGAPTKTGSPNPVIEEPVSIAV